MSTASTACFTHPHWAAVARGGEAELKEALLTGYRQGKPFSPHRYDFFTPGAKAARILDFGCGIGRNFPRLRRHGVEVVAYDIAEMIDACRIHADCTGVILSGDWEFVRRQRFDVCVATLVFQHIEDTDALVFYLNELSRMCDYLYISSRCWIDGADHRNILQAIRDAGGFEFIKGTMSETEILQLVFPDDTHVDMLLKSVDSVGTFEESSRLFDIHAMNYPVVTERIPITVTQLFTPNYDHWAYKVLQNKREYCDRHGYRFHYRRGIFEHAADRHPSWHRIPLMLELLSDESNEWIFWSDIDSLIMRQDVRLESIIGEYRDSDLIVPNQGAGKYLESPVDDCLCFGQFFLRNSDWTRDFLDEIWRFPQKYGYEKYMTEESWEQEAVNFIYRNDLLEFSRHAEIVPNRMFNSFYHSQYRDGDFLIHFAGEAARGAGRRETLIDAYLAR